MTKEDILNAMRSSTTGVNMNTKRRERDLCVVTDQKRYIWVVAGCQVCSAGEFVERYDVLENKWLEVGRNVPNYEFSNKNTKKIHLIAAQGCIYSEGFIFALFSKTFNARLDRHFYVYDTVNTACWQEAAGGPMGCVLDPPLSTWELLG